MQSYADRGVFRAFNEAAARNGTAEFRFLWFPITNEPFRLVFSEKTNTLTFRNLLQQMPAKSEQYAELRKFVKERCSQELREHRRIDADKADVKCSNRGGNFSLSLKVAGNHHEYGVRKAVNLVNDIFMDLLQESTYYEYMQEHFDLPEE